MVCLFVVSCTLAKKRKARPSSPEHGERGGGGKRFVKTNVRHNDYIEVDTQYLDDMEIDDDDGFEMTQAQATVSSPSSVGSRSGGSKTPQQQAAEAKSRPTERERAPYVQVSSPPANNSIARQSSLMNMNSGGSLMFIGRQFCFSGVEKEQQARFEDAVQRHAGKIISTIDALREKLRSLKEEREAEAVGPAAVALGIDGRAEAYLLLGVQVVVAHVEEPRRIAARLVGVVVVVVVVVPRGVKDGERGSE